MSPNGNEARKNIVKEYKANTDESTTTNPYPAITHLHTYTLKFMHTVRLYAAITHPHTLCTLKL